MFFNDIRLANPATASPAALQLIQHRDIGQDAVAQSLRDRTIHLTDSLIAQFTHLPT